MISTNLFIHIPHEGDTSLNVLQNVVENDKFRNYFERKAASVLESFRLPRVKRLKSLKFYLYAMIVDFSTVNDQNCHILHKKVAQIPRTWLGI